MGIVRIIFSIFLRIDDRYSIYEGLCCFRYNRFDKHPMIMCKVNNNCVGIIICAKIYSMNNIIMLRDGLRIYCCKSFINSGTHADITCFD